MIAVAESAKAHADQLWLRRRPSGRPRCHATEVINIRLTPAVLDRFHRVALRAGLPTRTVIRLVLEMHAPSDELVAELPLFPEL